MATSTFKIETNEEIIARVEALAIKIEENIGRN